MTIRVACTALMKRIKAGHPNRDRQSFRGGGVDVTSDVLKAVIEYVEPGRVVSVDVDGSPRFEIEVRDLSAVAAQNAGNHGSAADGGTDLVGDGADLEANPLYVVRMAAITSAACGYWNPSDSIKPQYETQALRDVAALWRKFARGLQIIKDLNGELSALRERAAAPQAASGATAHATLAAGGKDRDRALFEAAYVAHMNSQAIHRRTGMRDYTVEEISALRSGDHYNAGTDSRDGYLNGCWWGWQTRGAAAPADAAQLLAEHVVDPAALAVGVPGSTLDPVAEALSVGKAEIMQRIPSVARLYFTGLGARRYRRASTQSGPGEPLVHRSHAEREIHRLLVDLINARSALAQATLARVFSPSVVDALEAISQHAHAAHGLGGERHMEITLGEVADRLLVIVEEHRGGAGLRESRPG